MNTNNTTIKKFFTGANQYAIPVYQRAYSWEEKQWRAFFEDLQEATKGENHYFFGNVLLEKIKNSEVIDIIDGQQRISTIVIFVRSVLDVLEKRNANEDYLKELKEDYIEYRNKQKLIPIEYDKDYFQHTIIDNKPDKPQTPSQTRIQKAREFFTKELGELGELGDDKITKILESMEKAEMLETTFDNKKDSVLMFELQNNRGKDLTNLEKLKSYLSYQIYTYCSADEAEFKLNKMTKTFEEIYRLIPSIPLITPNNKNKKDEDSILGYYNQVKCRLGYNYRENDNDLNYKKTLKEIADKEGKLKLLEFIDDYILGLKQAFLDFKSFCECGDYYAKLILELDVDPIYPFIIKAYQLYRDNKNELGKIFEALEIMAFRHKATTRKTDLRINLNELLKSFGDTKLLLIEGLDKVLLNDYKNSFNESEAFVYGKKANKDMIQYVLKRYEDHLRQSSPKTSDYQSLFDDGIKYEIEHIAPQTENKQENSGYCDYKDFDEGHSDTEESKIKNSEYYLNMIGNLVLISPTHNRSNGNDTFKKKLEGFNTSPLAQQREIAEFANEKDGMPFWDKEAIKKRYNHLSSFIRNTWDIRKP